MYIYMKKTKSIAILLKQTKIHIDLDTSMKTSVIILGVWGLSELFPFCNLSVCVSFLLHLC